jgi:FtsP/CotA-like multicopper oxidase with cupredoxin domain
MEPKTPVCKRKYVQLNIPKLVDFSNICKKDDVKIVIYNAQHKFSKDADFSGVDEKKSPIFGSKVYINDKLFTESTFGMPFIRFAQNSKPKIIYDNQTLYTTNIHYHGLNIPANIDGVSMEVVFGLNTSLGRSPTFQFPEITNNQCMLFYHSHNMFVSIELIISGILGILDITDKPTKWLTEKFEYGDNQISLAALDMDFTDKGIQIKDNIVKGDSRSCFTVINGISCINWYKDGPAPFVNPMYHTSSKNLVKIDIVNSTANWRVYYTGICDVDGCIKTFYHVQNDGGLLNPMKLTMLTIPVAGRSSIIVDLNEFRNNVAHVFFYDFDLTEVFGSKPTFPDKPNNPSLTGTIPNLEVSNPTPFPNPIPGDATNLTYPTVAKIPQVEEVLRNGGIIPPKEFNIKVFLRLNMKEEGKNFKLSKVISKIRKTIFGLENYKTLKSLSAFKCLEYNDKINYIKFLNPNYYYNLPKTSLDVPKRNIALFGEVDTNAYPKNPNGTTEYVLGAARIMNDLWNSEELDLDYALQQYNLSPNNFKPSILPTSKFRIFETDDRYSNTAAISNSILKVQIFDKPISYGVFNQKPLKEVTINIKPTKTCQLMNVQEWIDLINSTFEKTTVRINHQKIVLNTILTCDWSFFPYAINFEYAKTVYIKSGVIKTINSSKYYIRLLGRWPLLQFFGKPLTGSSAVPFVDGDVMHHRRQKIMKKHNIVNTSNTCNIEVYDNPDLYIRCDEFKKYGTLDAEIQHLFPFYATSKGDMQLPVACMVRDAELIICPNSTYIGLWSGYQNDNLSSFSVDLHSSEIWIYSNGDDSDAHSLHFHLTQGFSSPQSEFTSPGLLSCRRDYDPLTYSRDVYQIGPQQTVSFNLTWPHYSSRETTRSPHIPCISGVLHCHLLVHNDLNSMMCSYYVNPPKEKDDKKCEESV